jgi:ubiquitin
MNLAQDEVLGKAKTEKHHLTAVGLRGGDGRSASKTPSMPTHSCCDVNVCAQSRGYDAPAIRAIETSY